MKVSVEKLRLIADLCFPVETRVFLTSSNWGLIAMEIDRNFRANLIMPTGRPTPRTFQQLKIRSTIFVNSGTDDQDVCNILNAPEEAKTPFRYREANFVARRA